MGIYEEAIKRPFTDFKKLLIGILISIFPIINFIAIGYSLVAAKSAFKQDYTLPKWEKFGNLFVKGLIALIVNVVYLIPVIIIGIFLMMSNMFRFNFMNPDDMFRMMLNWPIIVIVLISILALLAMYLTPAAILTYLVNDKLENAFNLNKVFKKAFTNKYFLTYLVMLIYIIIINFLLLYIPFIGGAVASFISMITFYTALASIYNKV